MNKLKKWILDSNIPFTEKVKTQLKIEEEQERIKEYFERIRKWLFIKDVVIEYYSNQDTLDVTPSVKASQEMEERIKTIPELEFWYKRALEYRKEQWKLA